MPIILGFNAYHGELKSSGLSRGMPQWRQRQRVLPVAEKIALLGRVITETRRLEQIKASWKRSVGFGRNGRLFGP